MLMSLPILKCLISKVGTLSRFYVSLFFRDVVPYRALQKIHMVWLVFMVYCIVQIWYVFNFFFLVMKLRYHTLFSHIGSFLFFTILFTILVIFYVHLIFSFDTFYHLFLFFSTLLEISKIVKYCFSWYAPQHFKYGIEKSFFL